MKIVIGHYHLHPGGVTKIIDSQIRSLLHNDPNADIRIICGHAEHPQMYEKFKIPVIVDEHLDYLSDGLTKTQLQDILDHLRSFFRAQLDQDTVVHFHNSNLGKNPLVTLCLYELATEGYCIFNHAHDFAEDRPQNMNFIREIIENIMAKDIKEVLYPSEINHYKFGVLNSADKERLLQSGLEERRIALLPNPVGVPEEVERLDKEECRKQVCATFNIEPSRKIVTYPVRVIRRKNIGECILLSELFKDEATFLVTLAPKNPVEIQSYQTWKSFCQQHAFHNILFEVANNIDFNVLVKGSDFCITTSLREGFGMTFMEPWLYNTPVVGRNIDYIVRDFDELGMRFPNNYNRLKVPEAEMDFKALSEEEQRSFILDILKTKEKQTDFWLENQGIEQLLSHIEESLVHKNKEIILKNYSFANYGKKLLETYQKFFR